MSMGEKKMAVGNSPSGAEDTGDRSHGEAVQDSAQMDSEFMGQYPPSSPRASRSPSMFRPQMPVVPLQRPDELHIPNPPWAQTASGCDDTYDEQRYPTVIIWSRGGKEVAVEGSWDDWETRKPLQKSGKDFTIMKVLPSGVYQYRFIVDGQWSIMSPKTSRPYLVLRLLYPPTQLTATHKLEVRTTPSRVRQRERRERDKKEKDREQEGKRELNLSGEEAWRRRAAMSGRCGVSGAVPRSPSPPPGNGQFNVRGRSNTVGLGLGMGTEGKMTMTAAQRMMAKMR